MRRLLFLIVAFSTFHLSNLHAAEEPNIPGAAQAEVMEQQITQQVERQFYELKRPPTEVDIDDQARPEEIRSDTEFFVREIYLEGDAVEEVAPEIVEELTSRYENKKVKFNDLTELSKKLEQEYIAAGFLAVVYVPPQRIEKQEVTLRLILSKMGDVHIEGGKYYHEWKTRSYWKVPKFSVIKHEEMRSGILDMNENPGRTVKAVLRPGKIPETTDVHLTVEDEWPFHWGFTADNFGSTLTGKIRPGFNVQHNNLLGLDDILTMGTVFGKDFGVFYLQHMLPIGNRGTKFVTKYSTSQVSPKKEFAEIGVNGISQTHGFELQQRIRRTATALANAHIGFDFKEKRTKVLSQVSVEDHLRVLTAGGTFQMFDKDGIWFFRPDFAFGLDFQNVDERVSSRGADASFFKFNFNLTRRQIFSPTEGIVMTARGQLSPDRLPSGEQMFLGGANSVRGYPESDYGADRAIVINVEHYRSFFFIPEDWKLPIPFLNDKPIKEKLQFLAFVDYGYGGLHDPRPNEHHSRTYLGAGLGMRIQINENASVKLEWGFPLGNNSLTDGSNSQFYINLQSRF